MLATHSCWNEGRIRISKRWAKGKDGQTKTEAADGYVPLHPTLVARLRTWREQSLYSKDTDFAFPPLRARGHVPLSASVFVADHLRPAAKKAGVRIEQGQRFGLHNLRHSINNWMVNKRKSNRKPFRESCVTQRFKRRSTCTRRRTAMKHLRPKRNI
jgi:integrase